MCHKNFTQDSVTSCEKTITQVSKHSSEGELLPGMLPEPHQNSFLKSPTVTGEMQSQPAPRHTHTFYVHLISKMK